MNNKDKKISNVINIKKFTSKSLYNLNSRSLFVTILRFIGNTT